MVEILQTQNLTISEFNYLDGQFLNELLNSPNWLKYIGERKVQNELDAIQYIKNVYQNSYKIHGFGFYKVSLKISNKPIGLCGFAKREYLDFPDIGFAFLPEYNRRGYGLESASALLSFGLNSLKFNKIVAIVDPKNEASIKLIKKLGLNFESNIHPPNENKELMLFSFEK
jgi:[ribosomal protein S5]-alanine N-acetyltransferase